MIEQLSQAGQVMTSKAPEFEPDIHKSTENLRTQFQDLFSEISRQNTQLSGVMGYFRDFKEETEKLSDWLKQININIKAIKTSLPSSLHDKEKSLKAMVDISQRMTDGKNWIFAYGILECFCDLVYTRYRLIKNSTLLFQARNRLTVILAWLT